MISINATQAGRQVAAIATWVTPAIIVISARAKADRKRVLYSCRGASPYEFQGSKIANGGYQFNEMLVQCLSCNE